ncbi:GAF domain-containing protein [Nocardia sp. NPDC057227]|uniref:GAF domain-containing protein n=1 Tax=Nocardia sp. NPDC057227 TaxID=3346056 RepID=UPI00363CE871
MWTGPVIPWVTIETLTPETMSVASVGESPRDFASWQRVLQRLLSKTPAVYDGLTTLEVAEAIRAARIGAQELARTVRTGAGRFRLLLRPVFGPAGDVHAVRLWLGPDDTPAPEPPAAVGAVWDLDNQTIEQPVGITRLTGGSPEQYVPRISLAELFHRAASFDRHAEVLDLLYDPAGGGRLQFDAAITHGGTRPGRWRFTIRSRDDERTRGAWLLVEDVTVPDTPAAPPTLERIGLREAHRRAGTHLAVLQLDFPSISHWLTDPAPWIRWDYLFRPVDVFHPGDRARLAELGARLDTGESAGVTVGTLNYAGGYTPTSLLLYPYPGCSSTRLAIAQLVRMAGDPARPAPADFGHPIGYDEQLHHRLAAGGDRSSAC